MLDQYAHTEILSMISLQKWDKVKRYLGDIHASEVVEILDELEEKNKPIVFRLLSSEQAAEVFSELETDKQESLIESMNEYEIEELMHKMSPDDRTALFEELPTKITRRVFNLMNDKDVAITRELLAYPEESIGRIMTPEYLDVTPYDTAASVLEYIREMGRDSETFEVIYIVDKEDILLGYILLKDLLFAKKTSQVQDFMKTDIVSVSVYADQEEAVIISKKYSLLYIPVVDSKGALIGIVTVDDILDIAEQEDTEDFHKLGAISTHSNTINENIKTASAYTLYKKRISWLFILVFVNIFSGTIIGLFEVTISHYISLVFFLPLLIDSAGNAGSQASTLVIRSLATGDVKTSDWLFMLMKEISISVLLGLTMSVAVSLIAVWRGGLMISFVVSVAMILVVFIGSIIGLSLPFILTKLKLDPATSSVPLVSSLCDISGTAIYLSFATFVLSKF